MRVLFLTPQPPYPPHAGNALRTLGLLNGLHAAGITIDLLTFVEDGQPDPQTTPAADLCAAIVSIPAPRRSIRQRLVTLATGRADMAARFWSDEYARALTALLSGPTRYAIVQFEGLEMACYVPIVRKCQPDARIIYGAANAEFELQKRIFTTERGQIKRLPATVYSLLQWRLLKRYERTICAQVDHVIATSAFDARAFAGLIPGSGDKISTVPNGIYTDEYAESAAAPALDGPVLLFTGSMGYRPNVDAMRWFVDHSLGTIRETVPGATLYIVGKNPSPRLDVFRQRPDVRITGFVQDVVPFLHSAAVYIAPLRSGSGTRLKLLQAMAAGCAIVSTTVGAQGIDMTPGREMVIADSAASFAQAVIALLRDPDRRATLGSAAQTFVRDQYDWAQITPRLLDVYKKLGVAISTLTPIPEASAARG